MKCAKEDLLLYAVTDRHWLNGRTLYEVVKESLDGGVTFLQLREKNLDEEDFMKEARKRRWMRLISLKKPKNCRNSVRNIKYHLSSMTMWISPLP